MKEFALAIDKEVGEGEAGELWDRWIIWKEAVLAASGFIAGTIWKVHAEAGCLES